MFAWLQHPSRTITDPKHLKSPSPSRHRRLRFESLEQRSMLTLPYVYIGADGADSETDQIYVYVSIDPPSAQTVSVDFTITGMTANRVATPGEDYYLEGAQAGVYSGTITFAPEEIGCEFIIGLVDDIPYEGQEWLRISLSNPINAQLMEEHDRRNADTQIWDNEDPYIVISPANEGVEPPSAAEQSYATFLVSLLGGNEFTSVSTTVSWTTTIGTGDTATAGADFQSASGTVTPSLQDDPVEIQVPIIFDGTGEAAETFRVTLTGATNGVTILGDFGVATIIDTVAVPAQQPPPDGQYGPTVGRTVTSLTSDHGFPFWEGDSVEFTAGLSAGPPGANESFEWHRRPLLRVTRAGTKEYGDWEMLWGSGNFPDATTMFPEPFIGEVRVKLTSSDTVSSKSIDVRAKAAFPENIHATGHSEVARRLRVDYEYSSSSGRLTNLDGVNMGEYFWMTDYGKERGRRGLPTFFTFPDPPFERRQRDGHYEPLSDPTFGSFYDTHGGGTLSEGSVKSQGVFQEYWYKITDGFTYQIPEGDRWVLAGDDSRYTVMERRTIDYAVTNPAMGTWIYTIDKSFPTGFSEATIQLTIPSFPWVV